MKTNQTATQTATILLRTSADGRYQWRQYLVITDGRVAIVHMTPALLCGWNIQRTDIQTESDWPGMTRDQIVAWKMANDDGRTSVAADINPAFLAKLLAA